MSSFYVLHRLMLKKVQEICKEADSEAFVMLGHGPWEEAIDSSLNEHSQSVLTRYMIRNRISE